MGNIGGGWEMVGLGRDARIFSLLGIEILAAIYSADAGGLPAKFCGMSAGVLVTSAAL